jgi:mannobiose 2-epimerase
MTAAAYRQEVSEELRSILQYWMLYTPDERQGGFIGRIDENDKPHPEAPKGLVLNSRILWTFSTAWRSTGHWLYRPVADRAYDYLVASFFDETSDGAWWSLDAPGRPLDTRKQMYGQAFVLYGLSEYYRATGDDTVLGHAIRFFRLIEEHSFDPRYHGYFEAFAHDWTSIWDVRLSAKDDNAQKTMNTHLHVLEAYTNLYLVWPDDGLRESIRLLLRVFADRIVDKTNGHLGLFFEEDWKPRAGPVSYGHDIEAAWLLNEAATAIGTPTSLPLALATAALEGLDTDGGLWYEKDGGHLVKEKHWWPQAEAMVGFLYLAHLTGEDIWFRRSVDAWDFVKRYIRQPDGLEWYWGVTADHLPMPGQDKAGFWKCPYHNSRACMEIVRLLSEENKPPDNPAID